MMCNMTMFEEKEKFVKISGQISVSGVFWGAIPGKLTKFRIFFEKCLVA